MEKDEKNFGIAGLVTNLADEIHSLSKKTDKIAKAESPTQKYGPLMGVFLALSVGGITMYSDVQGLKTAIADTIEDVDDQEKEHREVKEKLVEIDTEQKNLQEDVDDIKQEVKENSDKLDEILRRLPRE